MRRARRGRGSLQGRSRGRRALPPRPPTPPECDEALLLSEALGVGAEADEPREPQGAPRPPPLPGGRPRGSPRACSRPAGRPDDTAAFHASLRLPALGGAGCQGQGAGGCWHVVLQGGQELLPLATLPPPTGRPLQARPRDDDAARESRRGATPQRGGTPRGDDGDFRPHGSAAVEQALGLEASAADDLVDEARRLGYAVVAECESRREAVRRAAALRDCGLSARVTRRPHQDGSPTARRARVQDVAELCSGTLRGNLLSLAQRMKDGTSERRGLVGPGPSPRPHAAGSGQPSGYAAEAAGAARPRGPAEAAGARAARRSGRALAALGALRRGSAAESRGVGGGGGAAWAPQGDEAAEGSPTGGEAAGEGGEAEQGQERGEEDEEGTTGSGRPRPASASLGKRLSRVHDYSQLWKQRIADCGWEAAMMQVVHARKQLPLWKEACKLLRVFVLGGLTGGCVVAQGDEEAIFKEPIGTTEEVSVLLSMWASLDADKTGQVDSKTFQKFVYANVNCMIGTASPKSPVRKLYTSVHTEFCHALCYKVERLLLHTKSKFRIEDLMKLIWPGCTSNDLHEMGSWCKHIEQATARAKIRPPPVLPREELDGLRAIFDQLCGSRPRGRVTFGRLVESGIIHSYQEKQLRLDWDPDGSGDVDVLSFCEMMCPVGQRAHGLSQIGSTPSGQIVLFDRRLRCWRLKDQNEPLS